MNDLRHKFAGLDGILCGYKPDDQSMVKIGLSWDTITCPECRKLKQDWEPDSVEVPTKGD